MVDIYKWCNWCTSLGDFVVTMKIRYCLCSICFMLDICTVFIKYVSYKLKYAYIYSIFFTSSSPVPNVPA